MEPNVRQELDTLLLMLDTWAADHLSHAKPGDHYLVQEYEREINRDMMPYVDRLYKCSYITPQAMADFLVAVQDRVLGLKKAIAELAEEDDGIAGP